MEKAQKQSVAIEAIEKIEAKPALLSSKVTLEACGKNQDKQQNRRALPGQFPFSAHGDLTSFLTSQPNRVGRCVSNCPALRKPQFPSDTSGS